MRRGLRQGDPLSPLLFLLVAEGLTRLVDKAVSNDLLRGVGPSRTCKVSCIQYADDTVFFCEAKKRQVANLLFVWQLFEWASGLKVNLPKSELFYLGQVEQKGERLAEILGCKLSSFPIRYLGLPLATKHLSKADWWPVINRVEKRIEGWHAKLLSRGGGLILVSDVLSNLPIYYLSVFKAPKWVLRRIDALRRAFFWRGDAVVSRGHCRSGYRSLSDCTTPGGGRVEKVPPLDPTRSGGRES